MTAPTSYQTQTISDTTNALASKTVSINHSASGSNLVLVVWVTAVNDASATVSEFTSVTWNGVSLTRVTGANIVNSFNNYIRETFFYLVNPATGTHDLVITYDNTSGKTSTAVGGTALFIQDADQSSPIDTSTTGEYTGTGPSLTLTTNYANSLLFMGMILGSQFINPVTPGASVTELFDADEESHGLWSGTKPTTTAGSNSINATQSSGTSILTAVAIREAIAGTAGLARLRGSVGRMGMQRVGRGW